MVEHMFSNLVPISQEQTDFPQRCVEEGACSLPTSDGRIAENCISSDIELVECAGASIEGDADYAAINNLRYTDTLYLGLEALGFPKSIEAKIDNTRALDGMQTATSPDGFTATWTYHPDDGLNVIIEKDPVD